MKKAKSLRTLLIAGFIGLMVQPALIGCANHSDHPNSGKAAKADKKSHDEHPSDSDHKAKEEGNEHPSSSEHPE